MIPVGDRHFVIGPDDIFVLDGFSITPLPNQLRDWLWERTCGSFSSRLNFGRFDEVRDLVFLHYHTIAGPKEWGRLHRNGVTAATVGPGAVGGARGGMALGRGGGDQMLLKTVHCNTKRKRRSEKALKPRFDLRFTMYLCVYREPKMIPGSIRTFW